MATRTTTKTTNSNAVTTPSRKKQLTGVVVSTKMQDTVAVLVERYVKHPKYQKYVTLRKKFLAHDKGNTKSMGETVTIEETRPLSRHKRFIVISK
jgi:small subunit ribosomal protein S17